MRKLHPKASIPLFPDALLALSRRFVFSWQTAFFTLLTLCLFCFPVLSLDFGITWDEWMQGHYGKLILRYLISGGQNLDVLPFADAAYLYGGLFQVITGFTYAIFFDSIGSFTQSGLYDSIHGLSTQDRHLSGYYEIRHIFSALFGVLGIAYTGLLARRLGTWRTGCIAILLLLLSPRYLGHSMNNGKDIPFAASYIFSLYYITCLVQQLPRPKLSTLAMVTLSIALALGIRIGGILLIVYVLFFVGLKCLSQFIAKKEMREYWKILGGTFLLALIGYLGGLLFWPYALMNPLKNPWLSILRFSKLTGTPSSLLFEGEIIPNTDLPWYYIPKLIGITAPLIVLLAFVIFFILVFPMIKKYDRRIIFVTLFSILFPLAIVIIMRPILYDGWRHMIFIYPPMVVLAATAWDWLMQFFEKRRHKIVVCLIFISLGSSPLLWMVRNHPNEYVYFNPLVGGIDGANGYYQTDYWGNCFKEASEWLGNQYQYGTPKRKLFVSSHGNLMSAFSYLDRLLGEQYLPYRQVPEHIREIRAPDYGIYFTKNLTRNQILGGSWPPPRTIYEVKVDNTTICAVVAAPLAA